jgi:hypothetical protein
MLLGLAACGMPALPWSEPPASALELKLSWYGAGSASTSSGKSAGPSVALLEPFVVCLDCFRRDDVAIDWAPKVEGADFQAEIEALPELPFGPGHWRRTMLRLRALRGPGELTLPAFTVRARDGSIAASTEPLVVKVTSVLGDRGGAIEAPSDLLAPAPRWPYYAGAATAAALLLGLAWRRWPRRAGPRPADAVQLPAHVEALRALARLEHAPRTTPAQIEAFYVDLSQVLRVYLERRFGLRAPERTTEEFLRELDAGDQLARDHRGALQQFLQRCDLVKFAAQVPDEAAHRSTFQLALAFVERTRADRVGGGVAAAVPGAAAANASEATP